MHSNQSLRGTFLFKPPQSGCHTKKQTQGQIPWILRHTNVLPCSGFVTHGRGDLSPLTWHTSDFMTGRGKRTERGNFPAQGYAKRMKNDSACSEFRVVLCLILAMNGKGFQC